MANEATFTEVLEIQVLTDKFAGEMAKVEQIYRDSLNRMPNLDKVGGVNFAKSVQAIQQTLATFAQNTQQAFNAVQQQVTQTNQTVTAQAQQMAQTIAQLNQQLANAGGGGRNGGGGGFFGNLASASGSPALQNLSTAMNTFTGSSLVQLAKLRLAWAALNEVIKVGSAIIMSPVAAFKEGFDYLEQFQERSAMLRSILLQSVKYVDDPTKDWAKNVRLASEDADRLTRKMDDLAAKLRVQPRLIQAGFESFMAFGGRNLVKNNDEAMDVTGIATAALQAANPALNVRKVATEMQALVQGTLQSSSRLAASLGLSVKQLDDMSKKAQTSHDLLFQILTHAQGLEERLGTANTRALTLQAAFELMKQRWEALVAGPSFKMWIDFLQKMFTWLDQNHDQIVKIGQAFGAAFAAGFASLKAYMAGSGADNFKQTWIAIANLILITGNNVAHLVNQFSRLTALLSNDGDALAFLKDAANPITYMTAASRKKLQENATTIANKRDAIDEESAQNDRNIDFATGQAFNALREVSKLGQPGTKGNTSTNSPAPDSTATHGVVTGSGKKEASDALQAELDAFKQHIQEIKEQYDALREYTSANVTARKLSHKDAAEQIANYYAQEVAAQQRAVNDSKDKIAKTGADPAKIKHDQMQLDTEMIGFRRQADKAISTAQNAANAEQAGIQKAHYANLLKMQQDSYKNQTALLSEQQKNGYLSESEFLERKHNLEEKSYQIDLQLLTQEIEATAKGTKEREDALNKYDQAAQAHQQQERLFSLERQRLAEQEAQRIRQYQADQIRVMLEGEQQHQQILIQAGLTDGVRYAAQVQLLKLRRDEIDLNLRAAETELALAKAKNGESDSTRALALEIQRLKNARTQVQYDQTTQRAAGAIGQLLGPNFSRNQAQAQGDALAPQRDAAFGAYQQALQQGKQLGETEEQYRARLESLKQTVEDLDSKMGDLAGIIDDTKGGWGDAVQSLQDSLLGPDFQEKWDSANGNVDKFAVALAGATHALGTIQGVIGQYEQGRKQGGVLGGVGSLMSQGPVSDALSMLPGVGEFVKPLGQMFSFIGGMFTKQAQKIAKQIEQQIKNIDDAYRNGSASLKDTITALQKERQDAINKLSGKKGGKDQLNQILPGLDQEIAALTKQATEAKKSFEDLLSGMLFKSSTLQDWYKTWVDINKQVKDYLDAGGDINKANQFLAISLQQQRKTLQDNLNQGEQQAIDDAIKLNDLLQQRIDLEKQEKQAEFAILTKDAEEKRTSAAILTGQELTKQRADYAKQKSDLDAQIDLATKRLTAEKAIFSVASDLAALRNRQNALELDSLNQQLAKYQDMFNLMKQTADLTFGGTPNSGFIPGISAPISIQVNVGSDTDGTTIGNEIGDAITRRIRSLRGE
jgi:hypothetical protein